jgi:hypothetical protein
VPLSDTVEVRSRRSVQKDGAHPKMTLV